MLTFPEPTILALPAHVQIHFALAAVLAGILCALDHAPSKEALAALAAQHIVVEAGGLVPTHAAQLIPQHLRGRPFLPLPNMLLC